MGPFVPRAASSNAIRATDDAIHGSVHAACGFIDCHSWQRWRPSRLRLCHAWLDRIPFAATLTPFMVSFMPRVVSSNAIRDNDDTLHGSVHATRGSSNAIRGSNDAIRDFVHATPGLTECHSRQL